MARTKRTKSDKRPIEQYSHPKKKRVNNPPVGLVTPETDQDAKKRTYAYDPHLDPSLQWTGKAERTSFEVPTVSLHVHERMDPRTILEAVRKKNGNDYEQLSLFSSKAENPPLREAVEFYKHAHGWSNRLIAGQPACHEFAAGKRGDGRARGHGLLRPAIWHQIRIEFPAFREQKRSFSRMRSKSSGSIEGRPVSL